MSWFSVSQVFAFVVFFFEKVRIKIKIRNIVRVIFYSKLQFRAWIKLNLKHGYAIMCIKISGQNIDPTEISP